MKNKNIVLTIFKRNAVLLALIFLAPFAAIHGEETNQFTGTDTWANWERKLERGYNDFYQRNLPGRPLGLLLPSDPRADLEPITAYGYDILKPSRSGTIILIMPAPKSYPLNGIVMPDYKMLSTSFGLFPIDTALRDAFLNDDLPIYLDNDPFKDELPGILQLQLASLKYFMSGNLSRVKILPIFVRLKDVNSLAKDLGPYLAERIKDLGYEENTQVVILGNLTTTASEKTLIRVDNSILNSVVQLDIDALLSTKSEGDEGEEFKNPEFDSVVLGLLMLRWLGGDHSEVLAYAHSSQLVLTKDKSKINSYVVAGVASEPSPPPVFPHINREKYMKIFDELLRADILTVTRQTMLSILDATAAKPPTLISKQASKKWPVYVSIIDENGNVTGEAGSHEANAPLEESIRKFTFDAVRDSRPILTKENANNYIIEVSIPYGFLNITRVEDLIPHLHGIIFKRKQKTSSFHPSQWRIYPNPHQLLSAICFNLGLKPWAYATTKSHMESFRILAFNEKEPFQDLGAEKRKSKKKKKNTEDDDLGGGADTGGFTF